MVYLYEFVNWGGLYGVAFGFVLAYFSMLTGKAVIWGIKWLLSLPD